MATDPSTRSSSVPAISLAGAVAAGGGRGRRGIGSGGSQSAGAGVAGHQCRVSRRGGLRRGSPLHPPAVAGSWSEHGDLLYWRGYRLLALDGTCIDLPGRRALAEHFGTTANQHGGRKVQARLVMLQSPLVRLPLHYELTPLAQGERTVAARLLANL